MHWQPEMGEKNLDLAHQRCASGIGLGAVLILVLLVTNCIIYLKYTHTHTHILNNDNIHASCLLHV